MLIRKQTVDEAQTIIEESIRFAKTFPTKHSYVPSRYTAQIALEQLDVVLVADVDGKIGGMIGGHVGQHQFNPAVRVLDELFWWVLPEHRNFGVGDALLNAFVEEGKKRKVHTIKICTMCHSQVPDSYVERNGFRFLEKTFIMEL